MPSTSADGAVQAARGLRRRGDTNAGMSIVALDTGGFASPTRTAAGARARRHQLRPVRRRRRPPGPHPGDLPHRADSQASLTALSNGMVALATPPPAMAGHDIQLQLIDPATGDPLLAAPAVIADTPAEETGPSAPPGGWRAWPPPSGRRLRRRRPSAGPHLARRWGRRPDRRRRRGRPVGRRPRRDTLSGLANADALDGGEIDDDLRSGEAMTGSTAARAMTSSRAASARYRGLFRRRRRADRPGRHRLPEHQRWRLRPARRHRAPPGGAAATG